MKPFIITVFVLLAVIAIPQFYVLSQKEFPVDHSDAVSTVYGPDGRAAAGDPESYTVHISPALNWKKASEHNGFWRNSAYVVILLLATYVALLYKNVLPVNKWVFVAGAAFILAATFAAHSASVDQNFIKLTKDQYEKVKGNQDELTKLFDKPFLRQ